ncbi:hypothetical protein R20233_03750 [Ralstonia sp. LMG 32965]|jgi:FMN-dependent NADH-azoreductase|nr:hypothetical protein R20233_03750 [Ralstonia sp. LMG 32965]
MATRGNSNGGNSRSAITGRYVTHNYAQKHPNTTVTERRTPPPPPSKGKK